MSKYEDVLTEFSVQINEAKNKIRSNISYFHSLLDSRESELIESLNQIEDAYRNDRTRIVQEIGTLEDMRCVSCLLITCDSTSIKEVVDEQMCNLTASLKTKNVKVDFQQNFDEIITNFATIRIEDSTNQSCFKKNRSKTSANPCAKASNINDQINSSANHDDAINCSKIAITAAAQSKLLQSSRHRVWEDTPLLHEKKGPNSKPNFKSKTLESPGRRSKAFTYNRSIPFSPICYKDMEVMGYSAQRGSKIGELSNGHGIAIDSCLRRIYVCDFENNRVQVFFESLQPAFVFGESRISRRNRMEGPWGIDIEGSRVYVTQNRGHCVYVYSLEGKLLNQIGSEGAGEGEFKYPQGLSVDSGHSVYVCDNGNCRVQVFYFDGKKYHYLMEIGQRGSLTWPRDVYAKHAFVYILDSMSPCLQVWTKDGSFVKKLLTTGPGKDVDSPMFFTLDDGGNILVSDCGHSVIAVFRPNGEPLTFVGCIGEGLGCLNKPKGICLLPDGGVVCVDDKRYPMLQVFS